MKPPNAFEVQVPIVKICYFSSAVAVIFFILGYVTCGEQKNVLRGIIMQHQGIRMVSFNVNGMNNPIKRGKVLKFRKEEVQVIYLSSLLCK